MNKSIIISTVSKNIYLPTYSEIVLLLVLGVGLAFGCILLSVSLEGNELAH